MTQTCKNFINISFNDSVPSSMFRDTYALKACQAMYDMGQRREFLRYSYIWFDGYYRRKLQAILAILENIRYIFVYKNIIIVLILTLSIWKNGDLSLKI